MPKCAGKRFIEISAEIVARAKVGEFKKILLDLDGTLYPLSGNSLDRKIRKAVVASVSQFLNIDSSTAREIVLRLAATYGNGVLGLRYDYGIDLHDLTRDAYTGIDLSDLTPADGLRTALELFAGIAPLTLMTNSGRPFAEDVLVELGVDDLFVELRTIEDADFKRKPEPDGYLTWLDSAAVAPSEVIAIDDSVSALATANSIGMVTILVSNEIGEPPEFWDPHLRGFFLAPSFIDSASDSLLAVARQICT